MEGISAPISTTNGALRTPRFFTTLAAFCTLFDSESCTSSANSFDSPIFSVRAFFQRNKRVIGTREHHIRAGEPLLNDFSQPQCHIEAQIFFHQACWPDRSGVVTSMSGINHDTADF